MNNRTFDNFLEEWWMEHEAEGQTKDDSIEATERWIENLDVQELIDFANIYGREMEIRGIKHGGDVALAAIRGETV